MGFVVRACFEPSVSSPGAQLWSSCGKVAHSGMRSSGACFCVLDGHGLSSARILKQHLQAWPGLLPDIVASLVELGMSEGMSHAAVNVCHPKPD